MYYLLAVYRNRPDIFQIVLDGQYSINKAYTQMKSDEAPEEEPTEEPIAVERKKVEELKEKESGLPQIDESQPTHELKNRIVQMRKKALSITNEKSLEISGQMTEVMTYMGYGYIFMSETPKFPR
ncbi:hypothetical protein [Bacillus gobiensis]|uniref:Uncharacterized protein n=1 Tax=Bacillus gobiensis TaxID=1441095 RepID=A0A0M4G8L7_9BACI|nr:hypothetical protein [Bacillus gobiensis]ALC81553.1 hypothetical protein AM592_08035 [Bacillus gobiensis]